MTIFEQREEFYNDVSEVDADSDESESEEQHSAAMDERQLSELPRNPGHYWRKFKLVRGNPVRARVMPSKMR